MDLGVRKTVCSVDIAWYDGNVRQNNFVISVSNDGTTFTDVLSVQVVAQLHHLRPITCLQIP